jgi:hypothetical protein
MWTGERYGGWRSWGVLHRGRRCGPGLYSACHAVIDACSRIDIASWHPKRADECIATIAAIAESLFPPDEAAHRAAHALCSDDDFVDWENWDDGKQQGKLVRRFCCGDVIEEHYSNDVLDERRLRITCSPWSRDPGLRSRVIEAPRWVGHCPTCFLEGGESILSHPHPTEAPEAFELFCRWYGRRIRCGST